jgi:inosine/xanthosine triphosphatase
MNIVVATLNEAKVNAVKETLSKYDFLKDTMVGSAVAISGVSDQPKSLEETVTGAVNRAKSVFKDCDLSFGIESGLMAVPQSKSGFMDVCVCAIYDGNEIHLGLSSAFEPPSEIVRQILEENIDMTEAANRIGLSSNKKLGSAEGLVGILTKGRLTRQAYTEQAVVTALVHLENSHLFKK